MTGGPPPPPPAPAPGRHSHAILFVLALFLGGAALVVDRSDTAGGDFRISAVTVAQWLRDGRPRLLIADLRPVAPYREYHLPQARRLGVDSVLALAARSDTSAVIVVYGALEEQAAGVARRAGESGGARVYYLRRGVEEWHREVLAPVLRYGATPDEEAAFERVAELSRYFGGDPRRQRTPDDSNATARRRSPRGCGI